MNAHTATADRTVSEVFAYQAKLESIRALLAHDKIEEASAALDEIEAEDADEAEGGEGEPFTISDLPTGSAVRLAGGRLTHTVQDVQIVHGLGANPAGYRVAFTWCGKSVRGDDSPGDDSKPACKHCPPATA